MSGPIVRKYGFPNFEKIFGPKPILHGADPSTSDPDQNQKRDEEPVEKTRGSSEDSTIEPNQSK